MRLKKLAVVPLLAVGLSVAGCSSSGSHENKPDAVAPPSAMPKVSTNSESVVNKALKGDGATYFTDKENTSNWGLAVSDLAKQEQYKTGPADAKYNIPSYLTAIPSDLKTAFSTLPGNVLGSFDRAADYGNLPEDAPVGTQYAVNGPFTVKDAYRKIELVDADASDSTPATPVLANFEGLLVDVCDKNGASYQATMSKKWEALRNVWKISSLVPTKTDCSTGAALPDFQVLPDPLHPATVAPKSKEDALKEAQQTNQKKAQEAKAKDSQPKKPAKKSSGKKH